MSLNFDISAILLKVDQNCFRNTGMYPNTLSAFQNGLKLFLSDSTLQPFVRVSTENKLDFIGTREPVLSRRSILFLPG